MDTQRLIEILKNGNYSPSKSTTFPEKCKEWNDAIYEAREHGIPLSSFCDTLDKFVITPADLGYGFDYIFADDNWGCADACYKDMILADKIKAYDELVDIAKILNKKCHVSAVFIDGDGRGYLVTEFRHAVDGFRYKTNEDKKYVVENHNVVLFCYGDREELISLLDRRLPTKKELDTKSPLHHKLNEFLIDIKSDYDIEFVTEVLEYTKSTKVEKIEDGTWKLVKTKTFEFVYGEANEVVRLTR